MTDYSIALFIHIVGSLGFFVVLALEWIGLRQLRSAILPEQAGAIMQLIKGTSRLGAISVTMTILTGFYMLLTVWRGTAWILVVVGAFVLETVIFVVLSNPPIAAIERALASEKSRGLRDFHKLVNQPVLWISIQTRVAIILGIIFLKIAKPDLAGSLLTIGIATVLGLVSALPVSRRERAQESPAD